MTKAKSTRNGFLNRLLNDRRGNTVAIVAAAFVPLVGLIGGSVDMGRIYLAKTRLQQACDAGALAGRRAMANGAWTTSGTTSTRARANQMFAANFKDGYYGTENMTRTFTHSNGTVNGTVSVTVPMTLMKVFDQPSKTLTVTCSSTMALPNTDVMLVLDVTGSMNCSTDTTVACPNGNNGNVELADAKIKGLRSAVLCFYEALKKVDTSEDCGFTPSGTQSAQIRFGFVPYAANVNVGKLLPNTYLADNWNYQSRVATWFEPGEVATTDNWQLYNNGWTSLSQNDCKKWLDNASPYNSGTYPTTSGAAPGNVSTTTIADADGNASATSGMEWGWSGAPDTSGTFQSCRRLLRTTTTYNQVTFKAWEYRQVSLNVSALKAGGSTWNNTITLPVGDNGTNQTITWDGCIEERTTFQNTDGDVTNDWDPVPASALDMNIDLEPNNSIAGSKWGPMLDKVVFPRTGQWNFPVPTLVSATNFSPTANYSCPTEAHKMDQFTSVSAFESYVSGLQARGSTYHDIGLLWGARLLSPTGIFGFENATTPTGSAISRHIVFMTDGDTSTSPQNYGAYGYERMDRRQFSGQITGDQNNDLVNARTTSLCTMIKNRNITLHVVSFGGGVNATTEARLAQCATATKYYSAADTSSLITTFRQIANDISELRLTS